MLHQTGSSSLRKSAKQSLETLQDRNAHVERVRLEALVSAAIRNVEPFKVCIMHGFYVMSRGAAGGRRSPGSNSRNYQE
eukprot:8808202-Pyramimonas_sp.AAC.1